MSKEQTLPAEPLPPDTLYAVLEGADERLLRVLGKHPEMAYG